MGPAIAAQWVSDSIEVSDPGPGRQVSLAVFNVAVAARRSALQRHRVLAWTRGDPLAFFVWQAGAVPGVELATAFALARRALRSCGRRGPPAAA